MYKMTNLSTTSLSIKLLLFFLILCPGVYIGNVILNVCDVYIPLLFLYLTMNTRTIYRMNKTIIFLCLYAVVAFLSLFIASIDLDGIQWIAFLKWLRLLYLPMIYIIAINMLHRGEHLDYLNTIIMLGGCTAILGIILYMQQSEWYRAPQIMVSLTGEVVYRAGGVFAEPGHFSFVLTLSFIVANVMLSVCGRYRFLYVAAMLLCLWAIMQTYNRTCIISLFAFFLYRLCTSLMASWWYRVKALVGGLVIVALFFSLYHLNEDVEYLVDTRVVPLIEISSRTEASALSAGRADTWEDNLTHFLYHESDHWLFGRGYKIEEHNIGIYPTDNNFLSALLNTGAIGAVVFLFFWVFLLYDCLFRYFDKTNTRSLIMGGCTIVLFLYCLTSDAMTMYRGMGLFIFLYAMNHDMVTEH